MCMCMHMCMFMHISPGVCFIRIVRAYFTVDVCFLHVRTDSCVSCVSCVRASLLSFSGCACKSLSPRLPARHEGGHNFDGLPSLFRLLLLLVAATNAPLLFRWPAHAPPLRSSATPAPRRRHSAASRSHGRCRGGSSGSGSSSSIQYKCKAPAQEAQEPHSRRRE